MFKAQTPSTKFVASLLETTLLDEAALLDLADALTEEVLLEVVISCPTRAVHLLRIIGFRSRIALAFFLWRLPVQEIETLSSRGGLNFSTAAKNGRNFRVLSCLGGREGGPVQGGRGRGRRPCSR